MITVIAAEKLLDASSSGEALLQRVIEKVVAVEQLAMINLAKILTPADLARLEQRITAIKAKSIGSSHEVPSQQFPISVLKSFSDSLSTLDSKSDSGLDSKSDSGADSGPRAHLAPNSLWARAKSLFDLSKEPEHNTDPKSSEWHNLPQISFNQRGKTAGAAYLELWEIRLNPILLSENSDAFINEVIPHEYAHLLTFALFGRVQPHGKQWQMMMEQVMQLPAKRTHQFATENSQTRQYQRFTYQCSCQTHSLTSIRHNRLQSGKVEYHCRKCGALLVLK